MLLNFVQSSGVFGKNTLAWETEFEATGDFNLHIEKSMGKIRLYQRTAGGKYDAIEGVGYPEGNPVFDYDFTALVYPKTIKIVSEVEPTYAAVTTDGEITEIKSQSKEIEVTANGTTTVTPDAGFSYLNSVKVKTNVQSGGSKSTMKYYSCINEIIDDSSHGDYLVDNVKLVGESGDCAISPEAFLDEENYYRVAVALDMANRRVYRNGEWIDYKDFIMDEYGEGFNPDTHMEITEEEFYHIPEDITIERGDQEALGKVFETINKYALPVTREPLNIPLALFGYKSLTIGYTDHYLYETNLFWKRVRTPALELWDSWYDGKDSESRVGTLEAFAIGTDAGEGIGKITFDDGTFKYGVFNYIIDDED